MCMRPGRLERRMHWSGFICLSLFELRCNLGLMLALIDLSQGESRA